MKWQDFDYSKWQKQNEEFDHELFESRSKKVLDGSPRFDDMIDRLSQIPRPPWKPSAFYNKEGNQIETYLSDVPYYAKWLCPGLSVHLDIETDEIVGFTIEGISHMIRKADEECC